MPTVVMIVPSSTTQAPTRGAMVELASFVSGAARTVPALADGAVICMTGSPCLFMA
jgi:hypothetical protein